MKTLKKFLIVIIIIFFALTHGLNAQVPIGYKLEKAEDYAKYEKDVINCVNWLENTPLYQYEDKRKAANAFLIKWITGSPTVTIEINAEIVKYSEKNPQLLIIFMGAWTKLVLENPEYKDDKVKGNLAGLKSLIKVYKMGNGIEKDKNVEKLIKIDDKGELESWIKEKFKL